MATSPAAMTYSSLAESILGYSERRNDATLADEVPRLVLLAESECASDLKVIGNDLVVTSSTSAGNGVIEKPAYWRRTISLAITTATGRKELFKRTYEYLNNYWPVRAQLGEPKFYAEYNAKNFLIVPTPISAYDFELIYSARLDPLSDSNEVNWLTENAPQLLLYAAMYHTSLFLKNFDKADAWKLQYVAALKSLQVENAERSYDRNSVAT